MFGFLMVNSIVLGLFSLLNIIHAVLYYLELPFFEQYKDNDEAWPWKTDKRFKQKLWKAIKRTTLNLAVINTTLTAGLIWVLKFPFKTSQEDIPSL